FSAVMARSRIGAHGHESPRTVVNDGRGPAPARRRVPGTGRRVTRRAKHRSYVTRRPGRHPPDAGRPGGARRASAGGALHAAVAHRRGERRLLGLGGPVAETVRELGPARLDLGEQLAEVHLEVREPAVAVVVRVAPQGGRRLLGLVDDLAGARLRLDDDLLRLDELDRPGTRRREDLLRLAVRVLEHGVRLREHLVRVRELLGQRAPQLVDQRERVALVQAHRRRLRHGARRLDEVREVVEDGVRPRLRLLGRAVVVRRSSVLLLAHVPGPPRGAHLLLPCCRASAARTASPAPDGTRSSTGPPWRAMSLTSDDATCRSAASPATNTVSTPARCRFMSAIGSSASKSAPPRGPVTTAAAPTSRQKSTSRPGTTSTRTPSSPASATAPRAIATRSSTLRSADFDAFRATPTTTSSKSARARRTMSR